MLFTQTEKDVRPKQENPSTPHEKGAAAFLSSAETTKSLQQELLQTYQRLGRAWLDRMQAEMEMWNGLATKMAASKSMADALKAYTDCVSRQLQMSAEDGRHLFGDCQEISQKFARAVTREVHLIDDEPTAETDAAAERRFTH